MAVQSYVVVVPATEILNSSRDADSFIVCKKLESENIAQVKAMLSVTE